MDAAAERAAPVGVLPGIQSVKGQQAEAAAPLGESAAILSGISSFAHNRAVLSESVKSGRPVTYPGF